MKKETPINLYNLEEIKVNSEVLIKIDRSTLKIVPVVLYRSSILDIHVTCVTAIQYVVWIVAISRFFLDWKWKITLTVIFS